MAQISATIKQVRFVFDETLSIEESAKVLSLVAESVSPAGESAASAQPEFVVGTESTVSPIEITEVVERVAQPVNPAMTVKEAFPLGALGGDSVMGPRLVGVFEPTSSVRRDLTLNDKKVVKQYPPIDIVVFFDDQGDSAPDFRRAAVLIPQEMQRVRRCGINLAMNVGFGRTLSKIELLDQHQDLMRSLDLRDDGKARSLAIGVGWATSNQFRERSLRFIVICGDTAPDKTTADQCVGRTKWWMPPSSDKADPGPFALSHHKAGRTLCTLTWGYDQPFAAFEQLAEAGNGVAGAAKGDKNRIVPELFKLVFGKGYEVDIANLEDMER